MKTIEIIHFPTALIDPSPYQVREHFEPEALAELAGSIKEHGIIQPLTARVSPLDGGRLELVAGERRLRAGKLAELEVVPVIVHELSDRAAQEIVLIENLQREDLTVSEEARGYRKALDLRDDEGRPIYTQASLAQKIGKPVSHVSDRLKLLLCPDILVKAVESGEVALSTAMLVGRIPEVKARETAAKRVLKPQIQEVPLNYEQTREMIREEFMVSLQKPGFDKEDATLVPVVMEGDVRVMGGSCVGCPFHSDGSESWPRNSVASGRNAQGTEIKGGQVSLCTLPSCFKRKQDAAWKILAQHAEAQNVRVIQGDGAREIFSKWGNGLNSDAPYVMLDERPDYDDLGNCYYDNKKTFRSLLKGADVEIVIARHPVTGQRVELAEKKGARLIAKAKVKGKDVAAEIKTTEDAEAAKKAARATEIRAQKLGKITLNEGVTDLAEAIARKGMDMDNLDYLFQMTLGLSGSDGMRFIKDWLEIKLPKGTATSSRDYEEDILRIVRERATTPQHWLGFITVASLAKTLPWNGLNNEDLLELHQRYGIKMKDLERRAAAILDAGKKPSSAKAAKAADVETAAPETLNDGETKRLTHAYSVKDCAGWLMGILNKPVPVSVANEHGVFVCDTRFTIPMPESAGKHTITVKLATDADGQWYYGYAWSRPDKGDSLAQMRTIPVTRDERNESRELAVVRVMQELLEDFSQPHLEAAESLIDACMEELDQKGLLPKDEKPPVDANREALKQVCREWKLANPTLGVSAMAEELMIPHQLACEIADELIDEKAPKEMTFEEQVGALMVGSHKMADLIGKTPKKDAPERKPWDAQRVKLLRAVEKAAAEMADAA